MNNIQNVKVYKTAEMIKKLKYGVFTTALIVTNFVGCASPKKTSTPKTPTSIENTVTPKSNISGSNQNVDTGYKKQDFEGEIAMSNKAINLADMLYDNNITKFSGCTEVTESQISKTTTIPVTYLTGEITLNQNNSDVSYRYEYNDLTKEVDLYSNGQNLNNSVATSNIKDIVEILNADGRFYSEIIAIMPSVNSYNNCQLSITDDNHNTKCVMDTTDINYGNCKFNSGNEYTKEQVVLSGDALNLYNKLQGLGISSYECTNITPGVFEIKVNFLDNNQATYKTENGLLKNTVITASPSSVYSSEKLEETLNTIITRTDDINSFQNFKFAVFDAGKLISLEASDNEYNIAWEVKKTDQNNYVEKFMSANVQEKAHTK